MIFTALIARIRALMTLFYVNIPLMLYFIYAVVIIIFNYALKPSRLIVRSGLDVPTFATRRLHACHHARAPSGGEWSCGREMSGNFA
jgi:hypothetical protein